jgi:hypothetical protein
MMIPKALLHQAKAFLSWDIFPGLSIQLVELSDAVSFFYPPFHRKTIIVYYARGDEDFSVPLFHLFHEAGHCLQFEEACERNSDSDFCERVNTPTGLLKTAFEEEAWIKGRTLLERFIQKDAMDASILEAYDAYSEKSVQSYR